MGAQVRLGLNTAGSGFYGPSLAWCVGSGYGLRALPKNQALTGLGFWFIYVVGLCMYICSFEIDFLTSETL
jgi:hypothetical protein